MQDNPGTLPTRTLLDGVALSDYLAHLARNLPDLAERGAYGTLLVLVMAAGFVLAWLIQASRRQRVVRQLIETHIQEERAEQKKTRLLAEDLTLITSIPLMYSTAVSLSFLVLTRVLVYR